MPVTIRNAVHRDCEIKLRRFDLIKTAYLWGVIFVVTASNWSACPTWSCIALAVILNIKWLVLGVLYADLADFYLFTGLTVQLPLIGRLKVVPRALPDDYESARRLRGPNTWRCRRVRLERWFTRLDGGIEYALTPEILDVLWFTLDVTRAVGMVVSWIAFEYWQYTRRARIASPEAS